MLTSDVSRVNYTCDGTATEFAVPFKFFNNDDGTAQIKVYKKTSSAEVLLVENADFTVSGNGADASGKVVFAAAPNNVKLAILRNRPFLQERDFVNGQYLDMEELERSHDGIYMCLQQFLEIIQRALVVGVFDNENMADLLAEVKALKDAAQAAATAAVEAKNAAIAAKNAVEAIVTQLGTLADEINGEVI